MPSQARLRERKRVRHTRGYGTGRPAAYFALHQTGFFMPPTSPLARWAKLTMMIQSIVSLGTLVLVIARAVNILK